nr:MAG TPA: NikA, BACTERIAL CONJUGATION, RELAXASE, DNA [Caudoviricetes sp.]
MNIIEFQNRVNITVTPEEYEHIEAAYMMCDLDKDAFCRQWKRTNRTFIARRKAEIAAADALRKLKSDLERVYEYIARAINGSRRWYPALMPDEYCAILANAGINVNQNAWAIYSDIENFIANN